MCVCGPPFKSHGGTGPKQKKTQAHTYTHTHPHTPTHTHPHTRTHTDRSAGQEKVGTLRRPFGGWRKRQCAPPSPPYFLPFLCHSNLHKTPTFLFFFRFSMELDYSPLIFHRISYFYSLISHRTVFYRIDKFKIEPIHTPAIFICRLLYKLLTTSITCACVCVCWPEMKWRHINSQLFNSIDIKWWRADWQRMQSVLFLSQQQNDFCSTF